MEQKTNSKGYQNLNTEGKKPKKKTPKSKLPQKTDPKQKKTGNPH